ncbi:MAG: dTDP-4-dehydrorhamnose reductase [Rubritepida sp.]|nr:dTDP-4-dehydrorhamnose reductase [Rubritepida sp.]
MTDDRAGIQDLKKAAPIASGSPELWGGLECSVVRVGEDLRDQFRETGHIGRPGDLAAVLRLGISKLRYPVSWERVAPDDPAQRDWTWHDARLAEMQRLGIAPIVGLVHHGSGPAYTSLLDPKFPEKLADFAAEVARRYPWVEDWTPVNEPVTTARFSGLYGHWFPHKADEPNFLRMLAIQCRGVLLAMRAIRRVRPNARLVQTEDLGRSFATPRLQYQADHENQRRWLSLDLLHGRVDASHPWYRRLRDAGVTEAELDDFRTGDLAPMLVGLNYYITSERFLDHRLALHAPSTHGGNGRHSYADVEAVRVTVPTAATGWLPRLREAWQRYPDTPLAVTEAHLGSTPDEQIRWLAECWNAVTTLRAEGADLRAVTVWALFGAVDWCSLLTRRSGRYEPGAFDAATGELQPTAYAEAIAALARDGRLDHPVLASPGWWRRDDRIAPEVRLAG